jgi:hypothetical protein
MKRMFAVGAIAVMFAAFSGLTATASDGPSITQFRHLQRQVNGLERKVSDLQGDVRSLNQDVNTLWNDVFVCTFPGDPLVPFSDGSLGYVLYYDYLCTSTAQPGSAKPGTDRVVKEAVDEHR